jgi:hypothetical protein
MTINVRATSHTRLKARDHYTLGTFIGGKSGAGPNSLHITLEGPTEYVTTRWMKRVYGFLHGIKWILLLVTWIFFPKPPLGRRPHTKPEDHGTSNAHNHWFILFNNV